MGTGRWRNLRLPGQAPLLHRVLPLGQCARVREAAATSRRTITILEVSALRASQQPVHIKKRSEPRPPVTGWLSCSDLDLLAMLLLSIIDLDLKLRETPL